MGDSSSGETAASPPPVAIVCIGMAGENYSPCLVLIYEESWRDKYQVEWKGKS